MIQKRFLFNDSMECDSKNKEAGGVKDTDGKGGGDCMGEERSYECDKDTVDAHA